MIWFIIGTVNFTPHQDLSIGIIGGPDGPTLLFITGQIYPHILRGVVLIILLVLYFPLQKKYLKERLNQSRNLNYLY